MRLPGRGPKVGVFFVNSDGDEDGSGLKRRWRAERCKEEKEQHETKV